MSKPALVWGLNHVQRLTDLLEDTQCFFDVVAVMSGGVHHPDAGRTLGHGWIVQREFCEQPG